MDALCVLDEFKARRLMLAHAGPLHSSVHRGKWVWAPEHDRSSSIAFFLHRDVVKRSQRKRIGGLREEAGNDDDAAIRKAVVGILPNLGINEEAAGDHV